MFDGKNILVTGGAGFVGSNLILRLLDIGANVRASLHKKDPVIKDDRIQYVWCDLCTSEDCMRVCNDMDYEENIIKAIKKALASLDKKALKAIA